MLGSCEGLVCGVCWGEKGIVNIHVKERKASRPCLATKLCKHRQILMGSSYVCGGRFKFVQAPF